jgi:hypothetical protein
MGCALEAGRPADDRSTFIPNRRENMPEVFVTRNGAELTVSNPQVPLETGDWVVWRFLGLDLHEMACIHFHSLEHPYGPFQALEPSSFHVRGLGNSGIPGEYPYTAFVLDDAGVVATSHGSTSVVNLSATEDTSPVATIRCTENSLHVEPLTLKVEKDRTALWYVTGLPQGHFISFHFEGFPDDMVGPFTSFAFYHVSGESRVAIGTDFKGPQPDSTDGKVHYRVRLRRPDGSVLAGDDPVIEPPGWPPGSPE